MTPKEIHLAYKGYRSKMDELWEMVRLECFHITRPHLKAGSNFELKDIVIPPDVMKEKKRTLTKDMIMKVYKVDV